MRKKKVAAVSLAAFAGIPLLFMVFVSSIHFALSVPYEKPEYVAEDIYRGDLPDQEMYDMLRSRGITRTIDLTHGGAPTAPSDFVVLRVPVHDGTLPSGGDLARIKAFIDEGGPVYIHCRAGIGRTGSVIAYIQQSALEEGRGETLGEALSYGNLSLEQILFIGVGTETYLTAPDPVQAGLRVFSGYLDYPRVIGRILR